MRARHAWERGLVALEEEGAEVRQDSVSQAGRVPYAFRLCWQNVCGDVSRDFVKSWILTREKATLGKKWERRASVERTLTLTRLDVNCDGVPEISLLTYGYSTGLAFGVRKRGPSVDPRLADTCHLTLPLAFSAALSYTPPLHPHPASDQSYLGASLFAGYIVYHIHSIDPIYSTDHAMQHNQWAKRFP